MRSLAFYLLVLGFTSSAIASDERADVDNSMYSLFVTIHVQPDHSEAVYQATIDIAKASVTEPGCYRYDVLRDSKDLNTLYIFEVFADREAHIAHTQTAHFAEWIDSALHLLDGDMDIVVMDTAFPTADGYKSQKSGLAYWE
jgi:quinol monooxygenase YgiN